MSLEFPFKLGKSYFFVKKFESEGISKGALSARGALKADTA